MSVFDEHRLVQALTVISPKHRVAFAASCCERLVPNYRAFCIMERWRDAQTLSEILAQIWVALAAEPLSSEHIRSLMRECEAVGPDTEDFTSLFTGPALNAAGAVYYTLECCLDGTPEKAALAARMAIETLDTYLFVTTEPNVYATEAAPGLYAWIEQAPLLLSEVQKQQDDLTFLASTPLLAPSALHRLRQSSQLLGIQPFKRGIVQEP